MLLLPFLIAFAATATESVAPGPVVGHQDSATIPITEPTIPVLEVFVYGRATDLVGVASSASEGLVGAVQLRERGIMRTGEVLETIPGLIATQHAGGGKANQYFLRGFNLDHGTDFLTTFDGIPLNNPSHGHGQGYIDMNPVIPELVEKIEYQKGVYYSENGDFSSAGAAHLHSYQVLPKSLAKVEAGSYGYARTVLAASPKVGEGHLLSGLELHNYRGPWEHPDDFRRANGVLSYGVGDQSHGFSVTGRGYAGRWNSSDQIAESAVDLGIIPFDGTLDTTTGGESDRYSLQAEWHRGDAASATSVMGYWARYSLTLFSNFTYYLVDTELGDQFEQKDQRNIYGVNASHKVFQSWWGRPVENEVGIQTRLDSIHNGLFNTASRRRVVKEDEASGEPIPAVVREDDILQAGLGAYIANRVRWTDWFRTEAGLREDIYLAAVDSSNTDNSNDRSDQLPSPKVTLVFGPWQKIELYLQGGLGFHSNDARGATTEVDPVTGSAVDAEGNAIQPADPLVRTRGAEVGVRTLAVPGLQSTVSLWTLEIDSELLFVGDAGSTEASRPSRRYGIEWANFYEIVPRLTVDADLSFSHARFQDDDPAGNYIPGAIESVVAAGVTYRGHAGWYAGTRLRYFGPRPLIEDNSVRSAETVLLSAQGGYALTEAVTLQAEIFNLLDRKDQDIAYFYESRVTPESEPKEEVHYHPVEPLSLRVGLTAWF